MSTEYLIKGNIIHTPEKDSLGAYPGAYVHVKDGISLGVLDSVPEELEGLPVEDFGDALVMPGMVDLHTHAPQYTFRGTGMDHALLEWLDECAFPEETRYADTEYADRAYAIFAEGMLKSATTRAAVFATVHKEATLRLMEKMEKTGLICFVGKVNMDRDAPTALLETTRDSLNDTKEILLACSERADMRTKPIITPRFIPCCSDGLLDGLSALAEEFGAPVQSHLSENPEEVELVKKLAPDADFYGDGYYRHGLFGGNGPRTVMAHCIYSTDDEIELMRKNGVWVAHCPDSNMNIASGIAPIRRYLDLGLRVGLGTDVAGGCTESVFRTIIEAIQVSKLYYRCIDRKAKPLTFSEGLYMATKGGGAFFGKVGSFEKDYEFDAIVIDDSVAPSPRGLTLAERAQRAVYLGLDITGLKAKFVRGTRLF